METVGESDLGMATVRDIASPMLTAGVSDLGSAAVLVVASAIETVGVSLADFETTEATLCPSVMPTAGASVGDSDI